MDLFHLSNFDRGPSTDPLCEVLSKLFRWFQRGCNLKQNFKAPTHAGTHDAQPAMTIAHWALARVELKTRGTSLKGSTTVHSKKENIQTALRQHDDRGHFPPIYHVDRNNQIIN